MFVVAENFPGRSDHGPSASGQAYCGTKVCIQCAYINGECKPASQGSLLDAAVGWGMTRSMTQRQKP